MDKLPMTPRTAKVISMALKFAQECGHSYIGTEHLLVGLLRHEEGVAATVLANAGINQKELLEKIVTAAQIYWAQSETTAIPAGPDLKSIAQKLHEVANELFPLVPKPTPPDA